MSTRQRLAACSAAIVGTGARVFGWAMQRSGGPFLQSVLRYQEEIRDELARELGRAPADAGHQASPSARSDAALADLT